MHPAPTLRFSLPDFHVPDFVVTACSHISDLLMRWGMELAVQTECAGKMSRKPQTQCKQYNACSTAELNAGTPHARRQQPVRHPPGAFGSMSGTESTDTSYVNSPRGCVLPLTVTQSICRTRARTAGDRHSTKSWDSSRDTPNCFVAASRRLAMLTLGER